MASGCEWFYENVAKAKSIVFDSKLGGSMRRHPVRYAAGGLGGGMLVGRASGSRGLSGRSSGSGY